MITERAIELMEQTALSVGFSSRSDYPHLGDSPLSSGDYKGSSIVSCVFSDRGRAESYLGKCLEVLDSLSGEPRGDILEVVIPEIGEPMFVAVITAYDLVGSDECQS